MNNQSFNVDQTTLQQLIQAEIRREQAKNEKGSFSQELGTMGAGVAGGALGLAAIEPVRVVNQQLAIQKQIKESEMIQKEREILRSLRSVHLGEATFESFGKNAQILRELSNEPQFKEIVTNDQLYERAMAFTSKGFIVPFPDEKRIDKFKRFTRLLSHTPLFPGGAKEALKRSVTHPLVALGALSGGAIANQVYNYRKNHV